MNWRKKAARAGPLDDGLIGYLQETIELNDPPKQYLQGAFVPLLIGLMLILPWPEIGLSLPGSNTIEPRLDGLPAVPVYVSADFQRAFAQR